MLVSSLVVAALATQTPAGVEPAPAAPPPAATAPAAPPTMPMPAEAKPLPAPFAPKLVPYGFVDYQWSESRPPSPRRRSSTFEFRRARMGLRGDITPQVGLNVSWDAADSSMKDAFLVVKYIPHVELRLGQFKTPFGYEQQEADTKLLWLYNSYAVAALARGKDPRDVGALALGSYPLLDKLLGAEAAVAVVNGAGPNAKDDLDTKNGWGRAGAVLTFHGTTTRAGVSCGFGRQVQTLGADGKLGAQGSGATATYDDTYFSFHTVGVDATFDSPWAFVAAEWIRSHRHSTRYTSPTARTEADRFPRGWYVGAYGKTPWGVGPVVRLEEARLPVTSGAAQGTTLNPRYSRRTTLGAYVDVVPVNARLIFNYEFDDSPRAQRTGDRVVVMGQVVL